MFYPKGDTQINHTNKTLETTQAFSMDHHSRTLAPLFTVSISKAAARPFRCGVIWCWTRIREGIAYEHMIKENIKDKVIYILIYIYIGIYIWVYICTIISTYINDILRICFTRIWLKDALACLIILDRQFPTTERWAFQLLHRQGGEDEDRLKASDLIRNGLLSWIMLNRCQSCDPMSAVSNLLNSWLLWSS